MSAKSLHTVVNWRRGAILTSGTGGISAVPARWRNSTPVRLAGKGAARSRQFATRTEKKGKTSVSPLFTEILRRFQKCDYFYAAAAIDPYAEGIGGGMGSPSATRTPLCGMGAGMGSPSATRTLLCGIGAGIGSPSATRTLLCGMGAGMGSPSATRTVLLAIETGPGSPSATMAGACVTQLAVELLTESPAENILATPKSSNTTKTIFLFMETPPGTNREGPRDQ
jgi:hypothetical protein